MEGYTIRAHHGSALFDKEIGSQYALHLEPGGDGCTISAKQVRSSGWHARRNVVSNFRQRIVRHGREQAVGTHLEMNVARSPEPLDEDNAPG